MLFNGVARFGINRLWFWLAIAAWVCANVAGYLVDDEFLYRSPVLWPGLLVLTTLRLWDAGKTAIWNVLWLAPGGLLLLSGAMLHLRQEARYEAANVPHYAVNSGDYILAIGLSVLILVGQCGVTIWAGLNATKRREATPGSE